MKVTVTKEQLKAREYPKAMTARIGKKQAAIVAELIYKLIDGKTNLDKNTY